MNTKSAFVLLFVASLILSANKQCSPALAAENNQPNMLEITSSSFSTGQVQANVAQPQLVHTIYHAILSLPKQPDQKICALYIKAQYHLTFLRGASSVLRANVRQGGCSTVSLGQDDLRATDPTFWTLLGRTHALKKPGTPAIPDGLGPNALRNAYALPSTSAGRGQTIAIVDANDDPKAEADLAVYRATFGLPTCTTKTKCFRKVDQNGKKHYPTADPNWAGEIALDVDMASAVCPQCHILLVEAKSASFTDLGTGVNTAVRLGATVISNSYGSHETLSDATKMADYYNHPGVIITASSGDNGYGVQLPAAFKNVVAVGGTTLSPASNARGWTETAWGGAGSGCSQYVSKPVWQTDSQCSHKTVADVSAVADPDSGVAVYNSYESYGGNWTINGGTSASSPIVAAIYALAGNAAKIDGTYLYNHAANLNDVTSGTNGTCNIVYLCTGGTGYDGPTGLGTPNGIAAF